MDAIHQLIGADAQTIVWWQMVCRAIIIFFYTLLLVRLGGQRIFGKKTSLDIVVGVILGSIMSRALTANARFFPTLAAATALMALHGLLAALARRSELVGWLVKGSAIPLVENGKINSAGLQASKMTSLDLLENLRLNGHTESVDEVSIARLEASGEVSVIRR